MIAAPVGVVGNRLDTGRMAGPERALRWVTSFGSHADATPLHDDYAPTDHMLTPPVGS
jgi:hypothetical protein